MPFYLLYCSVLWKKKIGSLWANTNVKAKDSGRGHSKYICEVEMVQFLPPVWKKTEIGSMDNFHSTSLSVRCRYTRATEIADSKLEGF